MTTGGCNTSVLCPMATHNTRTREMLGSVKVLKTPVSSLQYSPFFTNMQFSSTRRQIAQRTRRLHNDLVQELQCDATASFGFVFSGLPYLLQRQGRRRRRVINLLKHLIRFLYKCSMFLLEFRQSSNCETFVPTFQKTVLNTGWPIWSFMGYLKIACCR